MIFSGSSPLQRVYTPVRNTILQWRKGNEIPPAERKLIPDGGHRRISVPSCDTGKTVLEMVPDRIFMG